MSYTVLKFGGTSVATAAGWQTVAARVRTLIAAGETPIVVHSALAGVSDALETILEQAASEDDPELTREHTGFLWTSPQHELERLRSRAGVAERPVPGDPYAGGAVDRGRCGPADRSAPRRRLPA